MINPITGWFEITQYDDKLVIYIANLVETTCMSRYPRQIEIMYDQGKELIGYGFRKSLIETEYGITHQVLGNLVQSFNISNQN